MKLLFDQDLSFKLSRLLADVFPESNQIRLLGMEEAADRVIWEYAKANDFILVSQDADFADMATLFGPPRKSYGSAAVINRQTRSNSDYAITRMP
jgi:predicted nuclease of predicted toxin-antitoxin system